MIAARHEADRRLPLRRRCALAGAGRTWYSTHPPADAVAARDTDRRDAIERLVLESPGYGYRRATQALPRGGWTGNHKRVLRVMRREARPCQRRRRFVATTDSAHGPQTSPRLLADATLTAPDQAWVADSTSIRLPTAFAPLACVLDASSRRVRRPPGRRRGAAQHGGGRQPRRQRQGGELLQDLGAGGGVPARVSDVRGG